MQQLDRLPVLITALLIMAKSYNISIHLHYYSCAIVEALNPLTWNLVVVNSTPFIGLLILTIAEGTDVDVVLSTLYFYRILKKLFMKTIVEIVDLITLYIFAFATYDTYGEFEHLECFHYIVNLQIILMLNRFTGGCESIARLIVLIKSAIIYSRYEGIVKLVHIKYSVLQYLPYDIFEKVHVQALYLKNVTLVQLFDKPPTFLEALDTLHIENTKVLRGIIWKLLEPLAHLRILNIYFNNIKTIGSDFSEHATKELKQLSFYETGTKSIKPGAFKDFINLDKLSIDHCKLTTLDRDMFPVPFNARYLYFNNNQLTSIPDDLFTNMPELQTIGLRSNNIAVLPESAFFGSLSKLEYFQLDGMYIIFWI
ncbi:hypothetical protein NPIL_616681 [Nephila pilipes]|uniref:Uncharacterized protein n=1 Tax=Nephila pilipes TaxID=299642 RepID=A0A8X6P9E6_NEPPI|nr:hypothetical protein NPIL_616681 [Nephila pilipes]